MNGATRAASTVPDEIALKNVAVSLRCSFLADLFNSPCPQQLMNSVNTTPDRTPKVE